MLSVVESAPSVAGIVTLEMLREYMSHRNIAAAADTISRYIRTYSGDIRSGGSTLPPLIDSPTGISRTAFSPPATSDDIAKRIPAVASARAGRLSRSSAYKKYSTLNMHSI